MISVPDATETVPRLWTGKFSSCDWCRRNLNFTCINVSMRAHTTDARCNFVPLCDASGAFVSSDQFAKVMNLIFATFSQPSGLVLMHCPDGISYSTLAATLYLQKQYALTVVQAYQWVLQKQPRAVDLSRLTPPRG